VTAASLPLPPAHPAYMLLLVSDCGHRTKPPQWRPVRRRACRMAASQHGESCGAEGAAEQRRGPGGRQSAASKATGHSILGRLNPSCSSSSCSSSSCSSCSSSWTVGPKAPGLRALSYPAPCPSSPQALPIGSRPEVMLSWLASQAATWRGVSWVVTAAQLQ
jgi:hypothetical protein